MWYERLWGDGPVRNGTSEYDQFLVHENTRYRTAIARLQEERLAFAIQMPPARRGRLVKLLALAGVCLVNATAKVQKS